MLGLWTAAKARGSRGKNWSADERLTLIRRWIVETQDATKDHKNQSLWESIAEHLPERPWLSCSREFGKISQSVQKFSTIISELAPKVPSDTLPDELIAKAKLIYQQHTGMDFQNFECWRLLKKHERYGQTSVPSSPSVNDDKEGENTDPDSTSPGCTTTASSKRRRMEDSSESEQIFQKSMVQDWQKLMAMWSTRNEAMEAHTKVLAKQTEALQEQARALREKNAINLFSVKDEDIPASSADFFVMLKARRMAELRVACLTNH